MSDDPAAVAVEQLEQLGLSTYAARSFIALVGLGTGTAADIDRVADVPRTRVYDAVEELAERGLVDIQQSRPKEFWVPSVETTVATFQQEVDDRVRSLEESLAAVEPENHREKQRGVWTVDGKQAVTDRVTEFIDAADEEIVYMTVAELLTGDIVAALRAATTRGVSIKLAGISPDVQQQIESSVPEAEQFESLWLWSDTPAGRLLMIDGTKTLVSVRPNGGRSETAIWGAGETNSLVVVLRSIFTWRLDENRSI